MRKLILQMQISMDGFIAGPDHEMDWMTLPWTDDINNYVAKLIEPVDCIILGRKLAEGFIPYWAGVAADKDNPEADSGKMFTETPKVVFSKTLKTSPWVKTVIAAGDLVEEINTLKKQKGKALYVCGGAAFVSSLIKENLVDDYHIFVNPVVLGNGLSIFNGLKETLPLEMVEAQAFDCGIVGLHYRSK